MVEERDANRKDVNHQLEARVISVLPTVEAKDVNRKDVGHLL
jgi:hypothetical protein